MVRGVVYEMSYEQARSITQTAVHATCTTYDSKITSVTAKDGNSAVAAAYNKLCTIANIASAVVTNNNADCGFYELVVTMNGDGAETAYSTSQKFVLTIYNNKTGAWDTCISTDKLSEDYKDASGNVKMKLSYDSFGICNNLTSSDSGTLYSNDPHKTVSYNYSPYTVGNKTAHFDYFKVYEAAGNQVEFTVTYDKVTAGTAVKHVPYEGDATHPVRENVNTFGQTATITCKYSDLRGKPLKIAYYTEDAMAHAKYYNAFEGMLWFLC